MRPDSTDFSKEWLRENTRPNAEVVLLLLLGSLAALIAAYIAEYAFKLQPCHLCLYQRIPYALVVVLCGICLFLRGKPWTIRIFMSLCLLLLLGEVALAAYHVGVEQGIFEGLTGCSGNIPEGKVTLEELRGQIMAATEVARCDKPAFVFLGISMAGWNVMYALGLTLMGFWTWVRRGVTL